MAITIDPAGKRLILGSATTSAKALYAAWVDWLALADNIKYLPAFRTAGGDDLGGGLLIPPYYFLLNGWRVRPMESDHDLDMQGNLFVEGGGNPFVRTLGPYQVNVRSTVPVQAQGIATGGGGGGGTVEIDPEAIAAAVRAALAEELSRIDVSISSRVAAGDMVGANVIAVRGQHLSGQGSPTNPWRPG